MIHSAVTSGDIGAAPKGSPPKVYDGRLGVYAALGGYARTIPLPWVPRLVLQRVRAALLSDLAACYGLSLTGAARTILSDPRGPRPNRTLAIQALRMAGDRVAARALKALGPVGLFLPLRGAVQTYVLGRLFDRYLAQRPLDRGLVVDAEEASRVRTAIDGALVRAVTLGVNLGFGAGPGDDVDPAAEWVDRTLQRAARVPSRLTRRLDAGFDDILQHD